MPFHPSSHISCPRAGYTLAELLIAISIFSVASVLIFQVMSANTLLSAKNTSLNKSNTEIQTTYYKMLSMLEESSAFVDCATYNATNRTFTAVAHDTWSNSVRFLRPVPFTGYVLPMDNTTYSPTNPPPMTRQVYYAAGSTTVSLSYNSSLYNGANLPAGLRLYLTFPNIKETVSGGSSPGVKPGLGIASVNSDTAQKLVLTMTNALPANTVLDCNRVYLMVESAFAVITDAADGHKSLLYIENTASSAAPIVISTNLDAGNHNVSSAISDSTIPTGGTSGTFSMNGGADALKMMLPIRDQSSNNFLSRYNSTAVNAGFISITPKFHERQQL